MAQTYLRVPWASPLLPSVIYEPHTRHFCHCLGQVVVQALGAMLGSLYAAMAIVDTKKVQLF
jgi:hypothetical protein